MLDALRAECLVDGVRTARQRLVEVFATRVSRGRKHIRLGAPYRERSVVIESGPRICVRNTNVVADTDQLGRSPRVVTSVSHNHCDHITCV